MKNDIKHIQDIENQLNIKLTEGIDYFTENHKVINLRLAKLNLTKIPDAVFKLDKLQTLNLAGNQITELPAELFDLKHLKQLILSQNNIEELPNKISQLKELNALYLSGNKIKNVPQDINFLQQITNFDISDNPVQNIPKHIMRKGLRTMIKYLQEQKIKLWQSKMVIVGQGGVGKSCLLDALQYKKFDADKETTHGMQVEELNLPHPNLSDIDMQLNVWDFGGQEIYHATHQFYLTNNSLFILVWSARLGYEAGRLYYWLETIEALAPNSPIIIVATHSEPRGADLPKRDILYRYPKVEFFEVDNKTNLGIPELREKIRQIASTLKYMGAERPVSWVNATKKIRSLTDRYIDKKELYQIFFEAGMNGSDLDNPAEYLHEMGDILYYKDEPELDDIVIVNPEWVSEHIALILDSSELDNESGFLPKKLMNKLWSDLDDDMRCKFIILMEKFELAYRVTDPETICLVVEKLKHEEPDFIERWHNFKNHREIALIYDDLSAVPAGIPSRFIARTHRFTTFTHWRNGAVLKYKKDLPYDTKNHKDHDAQNLALVISKPDKKQILLKVRGNSPEYFSALLRDTLELTLKKFEGLRYDIKVPCSGHNGQKCPHKFKLANLEKRLQRNIQTVECPESFEQMSVSKLLYGISTQGSKTEQIIEAMQDEFAKQAELIKSENKRIAEQFIEMQKFIELQFLKSYQTEQEMEDISCPNLFTLRPKNDRSIFEKLRVDIYHLELQLWCQHPGHQHPVGEPYHIKVSREWLLTIAPYYNRMMKFLRWTLPMINPAVANLIGQELLYKNEIDFAKNILKSIGNDIKTTKINILTDDDALRRIQARSEINALSEILKEADPAEVWGGLIRKITPEGYVVWICPEHAKEYDVRRKIIKEI